MRLPVAITPEAEAELLEAMEWYDAKSPGLGDEFLDQVLIALRTGVPLAPAATDREAVKLGLRRLLIDRFPYTVVLDPQHPSGRCVVAVAHQKRRPGYWKKRLGPRARPGTRRPRR